MSASPENSCPIALAPRPWRRRAFTLGWGFIMGFVLFVVARFPFWFLNYQEDHISFWNIGALLFAVFGSILAVLILPPLLGLRPSRNRARTAFALMNLLIIVATWGILAAISVPASSNTAYGGRQGWIDSLVVTALLPLTCLLPLGLVAGSVFYTWYTRQQRL